MIEARDISVRYDGRVVLGPLSLSLRPGTILALLGPNGAGKTTLIRTLNGTVPIASGAIGLNGRALKDLSRREIAANIAVVAQENETRFPITVLEFVLSGRFVHGTSFGWETDADVTAAKTAVDECDLAGYEQRQMNHLSGGGRQRVVLARALATGARLLLLDEPTANLDIAHQAIMFRLVRERCSDGVNAAIVITHDLNLASEFADEVVLLDGGCISARGTPANVLTAANIQAAFGVEVLIDENPVSRKMRLTTIF